VLHFDRRTASAARIVLLIFGGTDVGAIRRSLKHGGILLSERFHVDSVPRIGTTPDELAKSFADGFTILRNEVVEETTVWGHPDARREKLVHFAAVRR
jgi:hypothetical protein